ncbi:hypothetical protein M378DRAFT_170245 [Amanita muscaria Koide BX008]|uniref:Uncharacterized protein n=1 Tax=Amanita muscaria (strain Koide BX008) TaxID=946122 RepID=A0A0C2WBM4_AMAMK|nr:hypothetical protein M378DRAFT_170245 [Amanita muscaria Koide BX008]
MPSVSSPLKGGPRQRSLSQTLSELGFEEISIPGQPGSLPKKSTALPTSLQNTSEVSGLVVSANDAFSRMGTGKRRPKVRRSKTPAPAEITPSVAVEVTSEHRATTPTPAHAVAATSEQVKLPPASALFDEDVVFQSASTTNDAPSVAIMSAEHQELAPLLQDMPWMNAPETVSWQPEEPRTAQLFPGLPVFNPTETSLEDLDLDAEDLTVLPAELQQMLQEHEPLVDNKGGRPSLQTLKSIDDELLVLDKRIAQLSKLTKVSVSSIMKCWNTTKTRGGSLWNIYQRYFTAHKEDELVRLGLDPSTTVTGKVRADSYIAFRDAYPTTWPEVLEVWAQYSEVGNPAKTLQQRSLQFRQVWRTLCNLGDTAQRHHGFVLIAAMVGNEVHHNHSLASVYEAKDAHEFFVKRLHADQDKLLGLLKTYAYNATADAIIAKDAEMIAAMEDVTGDITVKTEVIQPTEQFIGLAPSNKSNISLIYEVKAELANAAAKVGLVLNVGNLPWVNILQICADHGIFIDNYPELAPIPCAKENGQRNKGVGNITKQERALIIEALVATANPMKFVRAKDLADVKKNVHPVLICAAPDANSEHVCSKRVFANGATDQLGHPRIVQRGSTAPAPPPRSKVTAMKSAITRTKPISKAYVDSTDEDGNTEVLTGMKQKDGPAKRTHSQTKPPKQVRVVESEDESQALMENNQNKSTSSDEEVTVNKGKGKAKARLRVNVLPSCRDNAPREQAKHVPQDIEMSPQPAQKMRGISDDPHIDQRVEPRPLNKPQAAAHDNFIQGAQMHCEQMPATSSMLVQPPGTVQPVMMGGLGAIPNITTVPGVPEMPVHPMHGAPQVSGMAPNIPGYMPMVSTWTPQMMAAYATLLQGTMAAEAGTSGGSNAARSPLLNTYHGGLGMFPVQNPAPFLPSMFFSTVPGHSTEHQELPRNAPGNQR